MRHSLVVTGLAAFAGFVTFTASAATSQRTFVASNGSDSSSACSRVAPCRTFAAAITHTSALGEIIVLDSGGYGPVVVTQSVSIIAAPGIYAGVSVFAGNGIDISGNGVQVTLRGLSINGQGGSYGIIFTNSDRLIVERCTISNMLEAGIYVESSGTIAATLSNVRIEGSKYGVRVRSHADVTVVDSQFSYNQQGIQVAPLVGAAKAIIERSTIDHSNTGIYVDGLADSATALVAGCQIVNNIYALQSDGTNALVYATDSRLLGNTGFGVYQGTNSAVVLEGNIISRNQTGISHEDPGHVYTMKNNTVRDNPGGNIVGGALSQLTFD